MVGTDFPDLYPLYRVPHSTRLIQETEVLANVLEMTSSGMIAQLWKTVAPENRIPMVKDTPHEGCYDKYTHCVNRFTGRFV